MNEPAFKLALDHHKAGRLAQAETLYEQALAAHPSNAASLNAYGVLAIQTGRFALATELLRRAVTLDSLDAQYRCNLGEALRRSSQLEAAIASFREAIRLDPKLAVAHNNLGIALAAAGDFEPAIAAYRCAIAIAPTYAEAYGNLGNALKELDRLEEAVESCRTAVTLRPEYAESHNQLASALAKFGEIDEAIGEFNTAIRLDPNHAEAHSNLGNALAVLGRVQDAVTSCEKAVELRPESIAAHWNFAVALLRAGDYERGWKEHEWRLRRQALASLPRFIEPLWDGEPLNGGTILLHAEQGFGDTIQFVRYVPLVAARGGRVIIECHAELIRLFEGIAGVERVIARGETLPPFDLHAPLMSLPYILQTSFNDIPASIPYLQVSTQQQSIWRERLLKTTQGERPFHVGLCWAGNSIHRNDRERSIPIGQLAPLTMEGVVFHSLQKTSIAISSVDLPIVDHSDELTDFAQTASLLANLDHVITVDTAVAHLSGAMGINTSALLSSIPDWRWMLHRQENAWYPTLRLYRQRRLGEWAPVVQQVARELKKLTPSAR